MDFHPAVFPEVQRCGIAVSTGQRSSECKVLVMIKEKKNKTTFPKGVSEKDFEININCTAVICKTILGLSFQF